MPNTIDAIWEELYHSGKYPAYKRVSAEHPMDLYAEISAEGYLGLMVISPEEPSPSPDYESVNLEIGYRNDGSWAISLVLARPELKVLFTHLCQDIIDAGSLFQFPSKSGDFVLARLSRWRKLLSLGTNELLTESEIRGLIGELLFLKAAIQFYGLEVAITGWNGPFNSPRDFEFPNASFEVKTVRKGSAVVRISSIDQLDLSGESLTLVVYELSSTQSSSTDNFTLSALVGEIRSTLKLNATITADFEQRLRAIGYTEKAEYQKTSYQIDSSRFYSVKDEFPRLARSMLPHAIANAKYDLFLAEFEVYCSDNPFTR